MMTFEQVQQDGFLRFMFTLLIGCVVAIVILYLLIKNGELKRQLASRFPEDTKERFRFSNNQDVNRVQIGGRGSTNISTHGDLVIGEDQAGAYVKIDGKRVHSGLQGNVKVEVFGNVENITCAHLKVTGDVNAKVETTHMNVTGSVTSEDSIDATHFTVGRDVKCHNINGTHINIGGKTTANNIKGVHVRTS